MVGRRQKKVCQGLGVTNSRRITTLANSGTISAAAGSAVANIGRIATLERFPHGRNRKGIPESA